jgi:hypothetical protein
VTMRVVNDGRRSLSCCGGWMGFEDFCSSEGLNNGENQEV